MQAYIFLQCYSKYLILECNLMMFVFVYHYNRGQMMNSNEIQEHYTKIGKIGQGSYGYVYLFEKKYNVESNPLNQIFMTSKQQQSNYFAIKLYKIAPTYELRQKNGINFSCLRQINCLYAFNHRNVLNCHQVIYNYKPQASIPHQVYVVMNFHLELNDLLSIFKTNNDKKRMIKQIAQGLKYLHDNYIFHRDLKPDNIFVSKSGLMRIADFGFAKEFGTPYKKFTINACTIEYRAPQIFLGTHYYTELSDIWSFGCIVGFIFSGKSLFLSQHKSQIQLLAEIFYLVGTPDQQNWPNSSKLPIKFKCNSQKQKNFVDQLGIPEDVADLMHKCMKLDPRQRLNTTKILQHPIFNEISDEPFDVQQLFNNKINKLLKKYQSSS